jgi:membrane protein required for colicin V production
VIAARLVAGAAGGFAKRSVLGPMDRVLGLGFGAVKGVILASVLFVLAEFGTGTFDPDREPPAWLMNSRSAPILKLAANTMVGWVRELQDEKVGGFALPEGMTLPPGVLPPGHPPLEQDPGAGEPDESGYSPQDRRALDQLLEEGAKNGEQVEI